MNTDSQTVIGIFANNVNADQTISQLRNLGYSPEQISVMVKDSKQYSQVARSMGDNVANATVTGATAGGALGALTGLLVGLGAIAIPGIGALFIGGPLAVALGLTGASATAVSAAATGVLAGGIVGALAGIGLPEEVAKVYESRIREGAIVIAVPVDSDDQYKKVMAVYNKNGADQLRTITKGTGR